MPATSSSYGTFSRTRRSIQSYQCRDGWSVGAWHLEVPRRVAGDVAELRRPPGGVGRACQQLVDLLRALVGRGVGQERLDLLGRRQRAGHVEADAAEELGVGAELRRDDAELAELGDDQLVDLRRRGHVGIVRPDLVGDGEQDRATATPLS